MALVQGNWGTLLADGFGMLLKGDQARNPLILGSVIEYSGVFENGNPAGEVLGVVLRHGPAPRSYFITVAPVDDPYMRWRLLDDPAAPNSVLIRLASKDAELVHKVLGGVSVEMVTSFVVHALPGEFFDAKVVDFLEDTEHVAVGKLVSFTCEMLAGEPREAPEVR